MALQTIKACSHNEHLLEILIVITYMYIQKMTILNYVLFRYIFNCEVLLLNLETTFVYFITINLLSVKTTLFKYD